jgi:hypothetical protein
MEVMLHVSLLAVAYALDFYDMDELLSIIHMYRVGDGGVNSSRIRE